MGRNERTIDPSADAIQLFAHDLRELRRSAGSPTYRDLARRCGYSAPTLSEAAAGRKLPSLKVTLAYVRECGGDANAWEQRWLQLTEDTTHQPAVPCPYPGLAQFRSEDKDLYFGREDVAEELTNLVLERPIVGLVGASGSGKSSLLRAGLLPRIRENVSEQTEIRIVTPGPDPLDLLTALQPRGHEKLIVAIDQFEELYTLNIPPETTSDILAEILKAQNVGAQLKLILSLRADCLPQCIENPQIAAALSQSTIMMSTMSREQIRRAVVAPATARGYTVEKELTERIVTEASRQGGSLPLMSHALREVWQRARGKALTMAQYDAVGGIGGAIEQTAENFYQSLSNREKEEIERILLRLIIAEPGRPHTRRPALASELSSLQGSLERLIKTRLVVRDGEYVELAHEAVAVAWPRLARWVEDASERMKTVRRISEAASTWDELSRDGGALYRGALLESVLASLGPDHEDLSATEISFIEASTRQAKIERDRQQKLDSRKKKAALAAYILPIATLVFWIIWFINRPHP
ncbi:nSTAND1 domain-containing NTPase [Streptomyces sp. 7N604]|uniref:nSTAND1 domain-containing NTPase n=1 Tax=Streptomyces sp. 7N604 TaxID=3457415 RepID=UPI003FD5ED64